jgi:hypothetical protein
MRSRYWRLIHKKMSEDDWVDFLIAEAIKKHTDTQKRMIDWLMDNLDHYSPERISQWTGEGVSSRVEGFFKSLKNRLEHQQVTLWTLAKPSGSQSCLLRPRPAGALALHSSLEPAPEYIPSIDAS